MRHPIFTKISSEYLLWKKDSMPGLSESFGLWFPEDEIVDMRLYNFRKAVEILDEYSKITFRPDMPEKFLNDYKILYYKVTGELPINYYVQPDENKNSLSIKMTLDILNPTAERHFEEFMKIHEIDLSRSTPEREAYKEYSTVLPWGCLFKKEGSIWTATNTMFAFWMFKCLNKRC